VVRRWERQAVETLRGRGRLAEEIRDAISRILGAIGDPPLPASAG
jgi:hypothetical protein